MVQAVLMESGAILIDKPPGITSSGVVTKIKWAMQNQGYAPKGFRIGHGGTLDPFATGVLLVLFGEATKLADAYLHSVKGYDGIIELGAKTDTGDLTGSIIETRSIPNLNAEEWSVLAATFVSSRYLQTPPMYSAKKVNGVALHSLARQGKTIEREALLKKIYKFEVTPEEKPFLKFEVACESGTYVRVLAEDLAVKAFTVAHLKTLRRIKSSDCHYADCSGFDEVLGFLDAKKPLAELKSYRPLAQLASHLPVVELNEEQVVRIRQGSTSHIQAINAQLQHQESRLRYALAKSQGETVALFEKFNDNGDFRLQRVFN